MRVQKILDYYCKTMVHCNHCLLRVCVLYGFGKKKKDVVKQKWTENEIEDCGAMELAEALKDNTILQTLYLNGEFQCVQISSLF